MLTNHRDRMPPLVDAQMGDAQRAAVAELIAGPRKGVFGPFIPLLRSPELLARLQKLGEYLRFQSALSARITELATLIVAREWTQQFEWNVHAALAVKAGVAVQTVDALREGRRPPDMHPDESRAHDFVTELLAHRGVSDTTYDACIERFGERGVVELASLVGYFTLVSMILNVAHTPAERVPDIEPLKSMPL